MSGGVQIEAYLQELQGAGTDEKRIARIRARLLKCEEYFDSKGITAPTADEMAGWKATLTAKRSDKTASEWVRDARNYYDWKKGQSMMIQAEEIESLNDGEAWQEEAGKEQHSECLTLRNSESVNECEVEGQEQHFNIQALPNSESSNVGNEQHDDTDTQITSFEHSEISKNEHSDIPALLKPKRGRRADPAKADRVPVSVYLPRATYDGIKDLAAHSQMGISDLLAKVAFFFIEKNEDVLARIREVKQLELKFEL